MTTHALVESPLQFLSALEAHEPGTALRIYARKSAAGMDGFLRAFDSDWLPAGVSVERGRGVPPAGAAVPDRILVGDPCSGRIQRSLAVGYAARRLPSLTILDDGLATLTVMKQLVTGAAALHRPRQRLRRDREILSRHVTARLRTLADEGRLEWVTALNADPSLLLECRLAGVKVRTHEWEYARSLPAAEAAPAASIVIGSSLAADGLIRAESYAGWLAEMADGTPRAYYPHRRESEESLECVRALPGFEVVAPGLPLELRLPRLSPTARIVSLPSTAVVNLGSLQPHAHISVTPIAHEWWTKRADPVFRASLQRRGGTHV